MNDFRGFSFAVVGQPVDVSLILGLFTRVARRARESFGGVASYRDLQAEIGRASSLAHASGYQNDRSVRISAIVPIATASSRQA